jgi:hypothetical protein
MKSATFALFLLAAATGSAFAEILEKNDRTKEFEVVIGNPKVRQFSGATGVCYRLHADDHAEGKQIAKHAFQSGDLKCSIVFRKGASLEESQLCYSDLLSYTKVTEAVKGDGTFAYSLQIDCAYSLLKNRPHPKIQAIVCDAPRSAIENADIWGSFLGWNQVPSAEQIKMISDFKNK